MLLVMRTLSIVPLNFKSVPWSAPLSRELLVFNSFIRSLSRALRMLLEVTTLNMLLRTDARQARDDLLDIALSLPFQGEVNTGNVCVIQTQKGYARRRRWRSRSAKRPSLGLSHREWKLNAGSGSGTWR
ncbi:temperature dependent protein affecting M2 dsRNA replication-domain-containing protein [Lactarius indigo]|nr:temperature dependent protein affecting M2 dsRNA replication-domain-containing protein [Lactarius indigo]